MFKYQNEWSVQKLFWSLIGFCHSSSKSSLICLGFRNSDLGFLTFVRNDTTRCLEVQAEGC